jgi:hypothetical protein
MQKELNHHVYGIAASFTTYTYTYPLKRGKGETEVTSVVRCKRHRDRRPSTTAYPGCWPMGTNKVKKCAVRKK